MIMRNLCEISPAIAKTTTERKKFIALYNIDHPFPNILFKYAMVLNLIVTNFYSGTAIGFILTAKQERI